MQLDHDDVELLSVALSLDFELESTREVEVLDGDALCPIDEDVGVGSERTGSVEAVDVAAKCEKVPQADELAVCEFVSELLERLEDTGKLGSGLVFVCEEGDEQVPKHEGVVDTKRHETREDLAGTSTCCINNRLGNVKEKRLDIVVVWDGHRLDGKLISLQKVLHILGHFRALTKTFCFCVFFWVLVVVW